MARSDVRIDYDTNDLIISKSDSNVFDSSKHRYDVATDTIILTVIIPSSKKNEDDWKTYSAHIDNIDDVDPSYDDRSLIVEYAYIDGNGLEVFLGRFDSIGFVETSSPSFLTVGSFKKTIEDNNKEDKSTRLKYFYSEKNFNEILIGYENPNDVDLSISLIDGFSNSTMTIDWGDGTVDNPNSGDFFGGHTYTGGEDSVTVRVFNIDMRIIERINVAVQFDSTPPSSIILSPNLTSLERLHISGYKSKILDIPDTLTSLYEIDVSYSTELKQISIPPNADYIGSIDVSGCVSLEEFEINPKWQLWNINTLNTSITTAMMNELLYMCMVSVYTDYAWFGTTGDVIGNIFVDGDNGTFENNAGGFTLLNSTPNEIGNGFSQSTTISFYGSNSANISVSPSTMNESSKIYSILNHDTSLSVKEGVDYKFSSRVCMAFNVAGLHKDNGSLYFLPNGYDVSECTISGFDIVDDNLYSTALPNQIDWVDVTVEFKAKSTESLKFTLYEEIISDINSASYFAANIDHILFSELSVFNEPDYSTGGFDGIQAYNNILEQNTIIPSNPPVGNDKTISISENGETYNVPVVPPTSDFDDRIPAVPTPTPPVPTGISDSSTTEAVIVSSVVLGDFVVEDSVPQNEYILLNVDEGAFLQNPTSGVGIKKYIQSPTGGQEIVDAIVSKFSLDNLQVVDLEIDETTIAVTSEPKENN